MVDCFVLFVVVVDSETKRGQRVCDFSFYERIRGGWFVGCFPISLGGQPTKNKDENDRAILRTVAYSALRFEATLESLQKMGGDEKSFEETERVSNENGRQARVETWQNRPCDHTWHPTYVENTIK